MSIFLLLALYPSFCEDDQGLRPCSSLSILAKKVEDLIYHLLMKIPCLIDTTVLSFKNREHCVPLKDFSHRGFLFLLYPQSRVWLNWWFLAMLSGLQTYNVPDTV